MPSDRKVIESILLLADAPLPARQIGEVLERSTEDVEAALEALAAEYEAQDRGFVLRPSAAGWRLYTDPECAPWLERFVLAAAPARLTGPALEVLAVIAYKGPLTRPQIADLRGVDSDGVVRTLLQRGLIREAGRDPGGGAAATLTVSDTFMERLGLRSLAELPPLADFMPDAETVEDMEARLSPGA